MQETQETWVQSLGQENPLEEEMAAHSSILAWEIPWTGAWWATVCGVAKSPTRLSTHTTTMRAVMYNTMTMGNTAVSYTAKLGE